MFGTTTRHPASRSSATPPPTGQAAWAIVLLDYDDVASVRVFTEPSCWSWLNDDHAHPPPALGAQLREMSGHDYGPHTQFGRGALTDIKARDLCDTDTEPGS